jgi:hypothetical protein
MKTIVVSAQQKPPEHFFYGNSWSRGRDPWHRDTFPVGLAWGAPHSGVRKEGWFLEDAFGNFIEFVPDGMQFEVSS